MVFSLMSCAWLDCTREIALGWVVSPSPGNAGRAGLARLSWLGLHGLDADYKEGREFRTANSFSSQAQLRAFLGILRNLEI